MIFRNKNRCICDCVENDQLSITTRDFEYKQFESYFFYKKCSECENIYLEKTPDLQDVKKIYPENYGAYSPKNFGFFGQKARDLAAFFKLRRIEKRIQNLKEAIEFGCGSQPLITRFNKKLGIRVTLCDIHFNDSIEADQFIIGNIEEEIKKINQQYDLIVFNQVIEHLCKPYDFLKRCSEILKPGGMLYFETPNTKGYDAKFFLENGVWGGLHAPRHFTIFNDQSIINYLPLDLKIIQIANIYNPFMLNESVKNWLDLKGYSKFKKFFRLSNPILLGSYILFDSIAMVLKLKTGNMLVMCEKSNANN